MLTKRIVCPSCGAGLKVADDLDPDTRIKCPKCKTGFGLPGDDEEEAPARAAARPRKARPPEDDDPDEEVTERRRAPRRPRRKKPEPSKAPMIVGLVVGLVVLLGGGGALAAVLISSRKKAEPVAENKGPVPPGYAQSMMTPQGQLGPGQTGPGPAGPGPAGPGTTGPATTGQAPGSETAFAAGRKVYEERNCARCHTLDGNVGGGGGRGGRGGGRRKVDLSRVGAASDHTVDWISNYIRDPKAVRPSAHMPAFKDKIQAQDLRALAEFLASLK
jgi:mono/diheme cytochrome c family protein